MKKVFLTILFLLSQTQFIFAVDYWVYIRINDKFGNTTEETAGRSKRGDIVQVLPVTAQFVPSETEKKQYLIIKTSNLSQKQLNEYVEPWDEIIGTDLNNKPIINHVAYRKRKLDIDTLGITVKPGIVATSINKTTIDNKLSVKTIALINSYKLGTFLTWLARPVKVAWNFYVDRKAFAATEITKTVNKTGEDYNTLTLWEDGEDGDLVTLDEIHTAACYDDDGALSDNSVNLSGWTVDSTRYPKITVPVGERHSGTLSTGASGTGFRMNASGGNIYGLNAAVNFCHLEYIQLVINISNDYGTAAVNHFTHVSYSIFNNSGSYNTIAINATTGSRTYYFWNNIIYKMDKDTTTDTAGLYLDNTTQYVYNNTVYDSNRGIYPIGHSGTSVNAKNNLCDINDVGDYYTAGGGFGTTTTNLSSDATSPNSSLRNKNPTYNNEAGNDYHLGSGDIDAKDAGTNLSADANLAFSDDIDVQTRSGTWDIGADEVVATAARRVISVN